MTIPNAELNILDGGLGVGPDPVTAVAIIGTSSAGSVDTPLVTNDATLVASTFGTGQLVDAASMLISAGVTVVCVKATTGTPGSAGSVTATRVGSSDGTIVVSTSVPLDSYEVVVEILKDTDDTADGDGTFRYSLDRGDRWSATIAIPIGTSPKSYTIPDTGVVLTFTNGSASPTFEDGDLFSFDCEPPAYTTAAMGTAYDALVANPARWRFVWSLGEADTAANSAAHAIALEAKLAASAASSSLRRHARGLIGAADATDANLIAAFVDNATTRVNVTAGFANWLSDSRAGFLKRSASWPTALRWATVPPSEDLGCVASGPLPRISRRADGSSGLYRDENLTPGLTAQRFTTLRTLPPRAGYYITEGRLMAGADSDFKYTQRGTVMDIACEVIFPGLQYFINWNLRKNPDGTLDSRDANFIQKRLYSALADAILRTTPPYVSGIEVTVRKDLPNLPADTLAAKFRIQPHDKARDIIGEVQFTKQLVEEG